MNFFIRPLCSRSIAVRQFMCLSRCSNYTNLSRTFADDRRWTVIHPSQIKDRRPILERTRNRTMTLYYLAVGFFMLGLSFLCSPFYKVFCQVTGMGGDPTISQDKSDKIENMKMIKDRKITIRFNSDVNERLQWQFQPEQNSVQVVPGETALAFYVAKNLSNKPIVGISTYNIVPFFAARYFNKIQVDMPVFFYIDPEYADDPQLTLIDEVTLSYTFFEAKGDIHLPGYTPRTPPPPPVVNVG